MGDTAVVNELLRLLEEIGKPTRENGVLKYECSSGLAADMVRSRILRMGDWSRTVNEGPAPCTQKGPVLSLARYPQVLVARAFSHGHDLDMTLYPGLEPGPEDIVIERLEANAHYQLVVSDSQSSVQADKGSIETDRNAFRTYCNITETQFEDLRLRGGWQYRSPLYSFHLDSLWFEGLSSLGA
jgi:hypothetical protein